MAGTTHIVGAGVAGLAAALSVVRAGGAAALYEAAPQAGGRCRTIRPGDGFAYDNGTHVLFAANRRALALIESIGARENWIEPEPEGLPVYDAKSGCLSRIGLSPWSWITRSLRPAGMSLPGLARLASVALPLPDRPLAARIRRDELARSLIEPLATAVLNTPIEAASSRRFGKALRRLALPGGARLLLARMGLGADLIEPALAALRLQGVPLLVGRRLTAVVREDRRATTLVFGERSVRLAPDDSAILALPPFEIARLLPELTVPDAFEPILNVHFRQAGPERPRFVGLLGTTAQWALLRSDHVSVTVSTASAVVDVAGDALASLIWREIAPALAMLGIAADPAHPPEARIVKERRATIRQEAGALPHPPVRPLDNLALAGDWMGALPATIESAVVSGERAAAAIRGRSRGRATSAGLSFSARGTR